MGISDSGISASTDNESTGRKNTTSERIQAVCRVRIKDITSREPVAIDWLVASGPPGPRAKQTQFLLSYQDTLLMNKIVKTAGLMAAVALSAASFSASAFWGGGPWGGGPGYGNNNWMNDMFGDGDGYGDFDMNMSGGGRGYGRGQNRYRDYYGGGYGPYGGGYGPYGGGPFGGPYGGAPYGGGYGAPYGGAPYGMPYAPPAAPAPVPVR